MMRYEILGSSSKGNLIIIEDKIMLDCGLAYSKIKSKLKNVKLIFISHVLSSQRSFTTYYDKAYCL